MVLSEGFSPSIEKLNFLNQRGIVAEMVDAIIGEHDRPKYFW